MIDKIIDFSLKNRFLVIVLVLILAAAGVYTMFKLPIDAVPDVTNIQVQVLTNAPALGPVEVEQFITFPVESAMSGLPRLTEIRSVSKFGLSAVTVAFEDGTDIYWARQLVMERLGEARDAIPPGYGTPEMGPISTGLGEIYQFEVRAETGHRYSPMELRTILDWYVAYQLKSVPGVVEVNSFGGELKTYEVQLDPNKLTNYKVPINRIIESLNRNNANAGGGYLVHNREQRLVRGQGLVQSLEDLENIIVETREDGTPIYIKNIGHVALAPMIRQGAVTRDGRGEAVCGIVMMLMGENSRVVVDRVKEKIEAIKKTLPKGITIEPFYDRTELVRKTIHTVEKNLAEGGLLVIAVLLLLLGNMRGGLIVALAIPLSMLFALIGMVRARISGNLMSLGAIDFGLIVDGSVVLIENVVRKMAEHKSAGDSLARDTRHSALDHIREAAKEVARPVVFGVGIIIIVYLPILTLQGIEGKMFKPMAFTVVFALIGSLLLSLTLMPVLASFFLTRRMREKETFLIRWAKAAYTPLLKKAMARPIATVSVAAACFAVSVLVAMRLGAEFVPKLDEGAIALQAWRLPSVSLEESIRTTTHIEQVLKEFPEIETIVSKTGRPEIATDPMGVEISDILVMLKPREQWTTAHTKEDLIKAIDEALDAKVPANIFSFSQPIELRVSELIAGVRSDVGISLYGDDLDVLKQKADEIVRVVQDVPGAEDVKAEQIAGLPVLQIKIRRDRIAVYGINASEVLDAVSSIGGKVVGQVFEDQKRFPLQIRFEPYWREDLEKIRDLRIADPKGRQIPLDQLAELKLEEGPAQISREAIRRRITIECNVRGRDLASFVAEAQRAVDEKSKLAPGYELVWGGQFKNLAEASARLVVVVPLALALIFVLLFTTFNSVRPAFLIYLNVPMAATGGVLALWLRGMPFSISAGVGFIALFGVAVLNGVVLVSYIQQLRRAGIATQEAAFQGALVRMRPVLMTALVASLGFVPMAIATSAGAEVQRPLATVVIGGLITSTLLTLVVLPSIYRWFESKERAEVEV